MSCSGCTGTCTGGCGSGCSDSGCTGVCTGGCQVICSGSSTGLNVTVSPSSINFGGGFSVSWNARSSSQFSSSVIYYKLNNGSFAQVGTGYSAGSVMVYPTLDNTPFDTYKNTACTITVMSNTGSDVSYSYGYVNVLFTPTQPANSIVISYVTPGSSASDVRVAWKYPSGTYGVNSGYVVQLTEYQSGAITSSYNVTSSGTNNESLVISKNNLIPGVLYYVRITPYYKVVLNLT